MGSASILKEGAGALEEGAGDFFSQFEDLLDFFDVDEAGMTAEMSNGSWASSATAATCSGLMTACADGNGSGGPCFPLEEEAAQLEWLSTFMGDSFCRATSKLSLASIPIINPKPERLLVSSPTSVLEPKVPTCPKFALRPRTRHTRRPATAISWTCPPIISEKPCQRSSHMPVAKRKWPESPRKCTHCSIEKTPQWRAAPLGQKALCNACGVRYKSGRLLPEYRPAASPTFVPWKHSNSHKKVIEIRTKKARIGEDGDTDGRCQVKMTADPPVPPPPAS